MPEEAFKVHGFSQEFLSDKKTFEQVADEFLNFINWSTKLNFIYPNSPGGGGEEACAFFGFNNINVPKAVNAAYLPNFLIACFLSSSFLLILFI